MSGPKAKNLPTYLLGPEVTVGRLSGAYSVQLYIESENVTSSKTL